MERIDKILPTSQPVQSPALPAVKKDCPLLRLVADLQDSNYGQSVRWRVNSGVPERYESTTFDTFKITNKEHRQEESLNIARTFARKLIDHVNTPPHALVLSSKVYGVGKTHLLTSIANEILNKAKAADIMNWFEIHNDWDKETRTYKENRVPIARIRQNAAIFHYISEPDLLSNIRDTFNNDSETTEQDYYAKLNEYQLLIIDDVGKVKPKDLSFVQQVYYRLIEYRYVNLKHIALATNLVGDELESFIGGAVASRLLEMTEGKNFLTMQGEDYRLRALKK